MSECRWFSHPLSTRQERRVTLLCSCGSQSDNLRDLELRGLIQPGPWFTDWYREGRGIAITPLISRAQCDYRFSPRGLTD